MLPARGLKRTARVYYQDVLQCIVSSEEWVLNQRTKFEKEEYPTRLTALIVATPTVPLKRHRLALAASIWDIFWSQTKFTTHRFHSDMQTEAGHRVFVFYIFKDKSKESQQTNRYFWIRSGLSLLIHFRNPASLLHLVPGWRSVKGVTGQSQVKITYRI